MNCPKCGCRTRVRETRHPDHASSLTSSSIAGKAEEAAGWYTADWVARVTPLYQQGMRSAHYDGRIDARRSRAGMAAAGVKCLCLSAPPPPDGGAQCYKREATHRETHGSGKHIRKNTGRARSVGTFGLDRKAVTGYTEGRKRCCVGVRPGR